MSQVIMVYVLSTRRATKIYIHTCAILDENTSLHYAHKSFPCFLSPSNDWIPSWHWATTA